MERTHKMSHRTTYRLDLLFQLLITTATLSSLRGATITRATNVGKISGYTEKVLVDGSYKTITKFMGIPFAESTAGLNRFQKPIAKAPFNDTFMATGKPVGCIQRYQGSTLAKSMNFSEDCLILNVYVPHDFTTNMSLPVMVWIHGGAFTEGASGLYLGDVFNAYANVIFVTINYRLGMFGFLQSADGLLPGNQGLWDQHLALKWVHENIAAFTGDPNRVTIFGESAGGASVLFQALYPGNRGLFQKVIAESGSPLAYWACSKEPNANEFLKSVGCGSSSDPLSCLRMKTPEELQSPGRAGDKLQFSPVVDGDFVVESPEDILFGHNPKSVAAREFYSTLDILSGVNNFDGALYMSEVWPFVLGYTDVNNPRITRDQFENTIVLDSVERNLSPKDNYTRNILQKVVAFVYTNWTDPDSFASTRNSTLEISSDVAFFFPAIRAAQTHAMAHKGNTYFYEFSVNVKRHVLKTPSWIKGSNHGDEITFVLCEPLSYTNKTFTEEDKQVARTVATMWSNFAKSGNPNSPEDITQYIHTSWPEFTMTSQEYFQISERMSAASVKNKFYAERMALWAELVPHIKSTAEMKNANHQIPHIDLPPIVGK